MYSQRSRTAQVRGAGEEQANATTTGGDDVDIGQGVTYVNVTSVMKEQ